MTICPKHQTEKTKTEINCIGTVMVLEHCDLCSEELEQEEKSKIKAEQDRRFFEMLQRDIPKRFYNSKLEDFENIDKIVEWVKNPSGNLFITGQCGTGKTHLAVAIAHHLREKTNKRCTFVNTSSLFLSLRNSFNCSENTEYDIIKKYSTADIAIFDDIGSQKISEYVIESWYNIINNRYGEELPSLFTSNMTLSEISSQISDRIASRIASGIIFELSGADRRILK